MQVIMVYRPELVLGDDGIDEQTPFTGIELIGIVSSNSEAEALQLLDNFKDECLQHTHQSTIDSWQFHIDSVEAIA